MTKNNNESPFVLRLESQITDALRQLAQQEGRDPLEQINWLIIEGLECAGLLPADIVKWYRLRETLVNRFGMKAVEIINFDGWRGDIIVETARWLMAEDQIWAADYERLIDATAYTKVNAKTRINPLLGRRAKLLLRATTGKPFDAPKPSIFTKSSCLLRSPKPVLAATAQSGTNAVQPI